jgi:hypothetical protein
MNTFTRVMLSILIVLLALALGLLVRHLLVNVPPVGSRRLLRSCPRWPRPDQKLFVCCLQDVDRRVDVPIQHHTTVHAVMNPLI